MFRSTAIALTCALALTGCDVPTSSATTSQSGLQSAPRQTQTIAVAPPQDAFSVAPANAPSGPVIDNFARTFLNSIQAQSFQERVEYCGYFAIDSAGQLFATPPVKGRPSGCDLPAPQVGQGVVASYHTHGAFSRFYKTEIPSAIDLISDFQFGIDGYVSTPGGRLWLVDFQTQSTYQLCGRDCLLSDPNYRPTNDRNIQNAYSLTALRGGNGGPS